MLLAVHYSNCWFIVQIWDERHEPIFISSYTIPQKEFFLSDKNWLVSWLLVFMEYELLWVI